MENALTLKNQRLQFEPPFNGNKLSAYKKGIQKEILPSIAFNLKKV